MNIAKHGTAPTLEHDDLTEYTVDHSDIDPMEGEVNLCELLIR